MYTADDISEAVFGIPMGIALICIMIALVHGMWTDYPGWDEDNDFGERMMTIALAAIGIPLVIFVFCLGILFLLIGILPGGFR